MKRFFLALALMVLSAVPAYTQASYCTGTEPNIVCTGPIAANAKFEFKSPDNVPTLAATMLLEPRVTITRQGVSSQFNAAGVLTCTGTTVPFTCSFPVPATMLAVLNVAGSSTVDLRLFDGATTLEGGPSVPFQLRVRPGAPTGLRILQ